MCVINVGGTLNENELLYVGIGWIFGIVATIVGSITVWKYQNHNKKSELKKGLKAELKQAKLVLISGYLQLFIKQGNIDGVNWDTIIKYYRMLFMEAREFAHWFEPDTDFTGINNLTNEMIIKNITTSHDRNKLNTRFELMRPVNLPYLNSRLNELSLLSEECQRNIYAIIRDIYVINNQIDMLQYYFKETFNSNIDRENREIMDTNISQGYDEIMSLSLKAIRNIEYVIEKL